MLRSAVRRRQVHWGIAALAGASIFLIGCNLIASALLGLGWVRHTIDDSSSGADGVRLADVDGDGLADVATPWEEGGRVRVCMNPGPSAVGWPWPAVTVGRVGSPEDAVLVDLDSDGATDVVSCCEGDVRSIFVHWAPSDPAQYMLSLVWRTQAIPAAERMAQWMFCLPMQIDGQHGVDLVVGAKGDEAPIGWLESPSDPRSLGAWRWHELYSGGWIMSLVAADMDGDGDLDVVASDRKGANRGCLWLENPGPAMARTAWPVHRIGAGDREVMFLCVVDLDQDGLLDVLTATAARELVYYRCEAAGGRLWRAFPIALPADAGTGKAVTVADVDQDGRLDIVVSCENAGGRSGVLWLSYLNSVTDPLWAAHDISGSAGGKFDLVELVDLDADGDLDVITCEEGEDLGVVWYENPTRR